MTHQICVAIHLHSAVLSILETTASDGKIYTTKFYRLEAILAVGYRVNSAQATDFRKWATETLNEFIIKGFVLDYERMKQGKSLGQDYFDVQTINLLIFNYLHINISHI